jgi:HEAT repeat protein
LNSSGIRCYLTGGDLRSDGSADSAANEVLVGNYKFEDLFNLLKDEDKVVRGRASHAIEKIVRKKQFIDHQQIEQLLQIALVDDVPMVKWHIAMILGELDLKEDEINRIRKVLSSLLMDESVFVKSWAIQSLCLIGRKYTSQRVRIITEITPLRNDVSIVVSRKAIKALELLMNLEKSVPFWWIKRE